MKCKIPAENASMATHTFLRYIEGSESTFDFHLSGLSESDNAVLILFKILIPLIDILHGRMHRTVKSYITEHKIYLTVCRLQETLRCGDTHAGIM